MKNGVVPLAVLFVLIVSTPLSAQVIVSYDFDNYTQDYECCETDGDCSSKAPSGFNSFHQSRLCGNYGN